MHGLEAFASAPGRPYQSPPSRAAHGKRGRGRSKFSRVFIFFSNQSSDFCSWTHPCNLSLLAESHDDIFEPSENYCLIQGRTTNVLCNSYRTNVQLTELELAYSVVELRFAHATSSLAAASAGDLESFGAANAATTIVRNSFEYLWIFIRFCQGGRKTLHEFAGCYVE